MPGLADIAVMRSPPPASPAPFEGIVSLFSSSRHAPAVLVLLKHLQFAAPHRVFAREPVAQGCRQHSRELFAALLGKEYMWAS
jgi:hypothetical protein